MRYLLLLLIVACQSGPMPTSTDGAIKGLTEQKQETPLWCGAASARMLLSQKGKLPSQCEIAGKYYKSDCCAWNGSGACQREVAVEKVLPSYGYSAMVDSTPTFAEVYALVKSGKPVAIYHYWNQAGHSVVAYWAYEVSGKQYVLAYNPYYGTRQVMDASWESGGNRWYRSVYIK